MFLLARRIKAMGVKMVLSGEGSDEIFGGYLYFHKAPNAREFHEETVRKIDALYNYDCLRANKSMMAWGVEPRVPFLDVEFLDVAMRMDAQAQDGRRRAGWRTSHREVDPARGVRRLPARVDPVAAERAVQRRRRLWLDRRPQGACAGAGQRPRVRRCRQPLPDQPAADEGGLSLPPHLRAVLPECGVRGDGAGRQVDRMLVAGGDRLGCGVRHAWPIRRGGRSRACTRRRWDRASSSRRSRPHPNPSPAPRRKSPWGASGRGASLTPADTPPISSPTSIPPISSPSSRRTPGSICSCLCCCCLHCNGNRFRQ